MTNEVELASLDLRYQSFRLKQPALEERLLASIAQRGIEEPLEGVEVRQVNVLLNGLKRHRCARKLRSRLARKRLGLAYFANLSSRQADSCDCIPGHPTS